MHIINEKIHINNCPIEDIAKKWGTPTYIYNGDKIVENYQRTVTTARKYYENFQFYYAIKACNNLEIAKLLVDQGAGIDAASVYEIMLAQALGLGGNKIIFTGNNLSDADIIQGLNTGAIMNLDDVTLLPRLLNYGIPNTLCFRVNPGYGDSKLGEYVTNAGPRAKFGVHRDHILEAYQDAAKAGIKRFGIHMMCGSCILDSDYFHKITDLLGDIVTEISIETGIEFEFIDLGGGLGIPYEDSDEELNLDAVFEGIATIVNNYASRTGVKPPKLIMEPARYFVGNAGYLMGRVHTIKEGYSRIAGTDISMNTLARPAMYGAYHHIYVNEKEDHPKDRIGVCGQVCENTDYWCRDRKLPTSIEEGDLILVSEAGAYGYSMSYEYNGRLRPAEVLVQDGTARLIRHRDDFKSMVRNLVLSESTALRIDHMLNG